MSARAANGKALFLAATSVPTNALQVHSAGTDICNGLYSPVRKYKKRQLWQNKDSGMEIYWQGRHWRMGRANDYFYANLATTEEGLAITPWVLASTVEYDPKLCNAEAALPGPFITMNMSSRPVTSAPSNTNKTSSAAPAVPIGGSHTDVLCDGSGAILSDLSMGIATPKRMALQDIDDDGIKIVYIVSKNSKLPLIMEADTTVKTASDFGRRAQWKVKKMKKKDDGRTIVRFRNVSGYEDEELRSCWLAIKNYKACAQKAGKSCNFIVNPTGDAVQLIHKPQYTKKVVKLGVATDGAMSDPRKVSDDDDSQFFIFPKKDAKSA